MAACVFVLIAVVNERQTAPKLALANQHARSTMIDTQRNLRNAEVAVAMGMGSRCKEVEEVWSKTLGFRDCVIPSGNFNAVTKTLRTATQSAAIAGGAFLVINQKYRIDADRWFYPNRKALSPIEQLVATWKASLSKRAISQIR